MDNNSTKKAMEIIEDILKSGLIIDVFYAERYHTMFKILCDNATPLNKSDEATKSFFSAVQRMSQDAGILALARVYDGLSSNKTRSIPYLLKKLKELAPNLPSVEEDRQTLKLLSQYNLPQSCCDAATDKDGSKFPEAIANHYESLCKESKSLKQYRDKIIAHNEIFDGKPALTWDKFNELMRQTKGLIEIIGMAYFSSMYQGMITREAERHSISTEIILRKLGVIEDIDFNATPSQVSLTGRP
jgi:hypothetical protein